MELIKEYLKELGKLSIDKINADEINGRSVTNASNIFYNKVNDKVYELVLFMRDLNNVARAYGKSRKNGTRLEDELSDIDMHFNFDKATQKELREKMAETFREVFNF